MSHKLDVGHQSHKLLAKRLQPKTEKSVDTMGAEAVVQAILRAATSPAAGLSPTLSMADHATRSQAMKQLQKSVGNRHLQRLVMESRSDSAQDMVRPVALRGSLIQRDGNGNEDDEWKFSPLPPSLSGPLGPLHLSADTSQAALGYQSGDLGARLGYQYGGNIFATGRMGGLSSTLGVNPGTGALSLSGAYDRFRFGASADLGSSTFGASLGYGSPLLPMPDRLRSTVLAGEAGARGTLGSLPGLPENPLGWYEAQQGNIGAATSAAGMLQGIAGQQGEGANFGAGLQLRYGPYAGDPTRNEWYLGGGMQYMW